MLRLVILFAVIPALALAKPKVAIAPITGEGGKEIERALVEVLSDDGEVVTPKEVKAAMAKLKLTGELEPDDAERLEKKVDAGVIIQGWINKKDAKAKSLRITVIVGDKKRKGFTLEYKSGKSEKLKTALREELAKRMTEDDEDDKKKKRLADEDDEDKKKKKRLADEDEDKKKKKRLADEDDDKKKKKHVADDDDDKKKKKKKVATADDDDDNGKVHKKRKKRPAEDEVDAKANAQAAGRVMVRVDAGLSFGVRRLTYSATTPPPRVGTASGGARIEGELYPFAESSGPSAGLGLAGEYDKTFGLSIAIPGGNESAPIDKQHFSIGARYRFGVGAASTIALGVDYVKRKYIADRSKLAQPTDLDAPDVDYSAIGPGLAFRSPVAPSAAVFGGARGLLITNAGPIQGNGSFGAATVYGLEAEAGVDIALAPGWALRFGAELSQINFKFKGNGARAMAGNVTTATDRDIGAAATLAMKY